MAITFEQKQGVSKSVIAAVLIVVLLATIGFFVWKVYWQEEGQEPEVGSSQIQLEYRVLNDERIISMELFPEIPAADEANVGKKNPFAESDATTTIEQANEGVSAGGAKTTPAKGE